MTDLETTRLTTMIADALYLVLFIKDPPRKRVHLSRITPSSIDGSLIWRFTVGRMYKTAQEPEVLAMIQQIMDAVYAKFPDLKTHPVKIVADRKGESVLDRVAISFGMMTSEGDPVDEAELDEEDED